jgi:type III restriction enzyme
MKRKTVSTINTLGIGVLATLARRTAVPNVAEMIEDLVGHITPPIKLTRKTLVSIVAKTENHQAALDNPQEFACRPRVSFEKRLFNNSLTAFSTLRTARGMT